MRIRPAADVGPRGGWRAEPQALRSRDRDHPAREFSRPVRCRRDEWYLARATSPQDGLDALTLLVVFRGREGLLGQRRLRLHAVRGRGAQRELLGWIETPRRATHLQIGLPGLHGPLVEEVVLHRVSERDPKCHPLANVPRWSSYRPPLTLHRVLLPESLSVLAPLLPECTVETLPGPPASAAALAKAARGSALVLDPEWVRTRRWSLADLERVAQSAWLLVDLETFAERLTAAGRLETELVTHRSEHGTMSARCEYADVPTRGLALQDVVPFSVIDERGRFTARGIRPSRAWKRYADDTGLATLLSGETPWADRHGAVLSAMRPVGAGELLLTDLPWLVAGRWGPLMAPRLAAHLLRMHLAAPLADHLQYWNRWSDGNVVVRDIADLAGRYEPLRAVRWATVEPGVARLGVTLRPGGPVRRHVLISTGRIDDLDRHDGLPPEPLMIVMRHLAREVRERTDWARAHLSDTAVTWQFDAADGVRYALLYEAAPEFDPPPEMLRIRLVDAHEARSQASRAEHLLVADEGLHGDGSLVMLDALHRIIRRALASD